MKVNKSIVMNSKFNQNLMGLTKITEIKKSSRNNGISVSEVHKIMKISQMNLINSTETKGWISSFMPSVSK